MTPLEAVLGALLVLSWSYWIVAALAVRDLFLVRTQPEATERPPVSILKPVRGLDPGTTQGLESFCALAYPRFEVLFGVADADDPIVPFLEALRARWPGVVRVLVDPPRLRGPNDKACLLDALSRAARHDVLVAADADMLVDPGYLGRVVSTLQRPRVAVVTCPYRAEGARTFWARLEALHMGVTFLPAVVLAARLGVAFAMGSTIAVRRGDLQRIGGFAAVTDHLADDYEVGARIASATSGRVALCPEALRSVVGRGAAGELWAREVRWSRCNWIGRPLGTLGYAVTFSPLLAIAFLAAAPGGPGLAALGATLVVRAGAAVAIACSTGDESSLRALPLLPIRDLLTPAAWLAGRLTRRVVWRGRAYRVDGGGRLHPLAPSLERHAEGQAGDLEGRGAAAGRSVPERAGAVAIQFLAQPGRLGQDLHLAERPPGPERD